MQLLPSAERGSFLAVVLLLIAVLVAYLAGLHWWFTAWHLEIASEMSDLCEQEFGFRRTAAARPLRPLRQNPRHAREPAPGESLSHGRRA